MKSDIRIYCHGIKLSRYKLFYYVGILKRLLAKYTVHIICDKVDDIIERYLHSKENYILDLDQYKHTLILENWIIKPIYVTNSIFFSIYVVFTPIFSRHQDIWGQISRISLLSYINHWHTKSTHHAGLNRKYEYLRKGKKSPVFWV